MSADGKDYFVSLQAPFTKRENTGLPSESFYPWIQFHTATETLLHKLRILPNKIIFNKLRS